MNTKFRIVTLSEKFYEKYTPKKCPELLKKKTRPYNCLLTKSEKGYYICIPFRSNVRHKDAFLFYEKDKKGVNAGLDYTKMVIVRNLSYINNKNGVVRKEHYLETYYNIFFICKEASEYITSYIDMIKRNKVSKECERRYKYSTLKYFHKELGI